MFSSRTKFLLTVLAPFLVTLAAATMAAGSYLGGGGSGPGTVYNQTFQEEGSSLTQRDTVNCVGAGITCSDSGGKTVITVPVPTSYATVKQAGSALTQQTVINFSGSITCANGSSQTDCTARNGFVIGRNFGVCNADGTANFSGLFGLDTGSPVGISCGAGALPVSFGTGYSILGNAGDSGWRTVVWLPPNYDPTKDVTIDIHWGGNTTANLGVRFDVATACLPTTGRMDQAVSYNAAQSVTVLEGTAQFTRRLSTITPVTMTGCAASNPLQVTITRIVSDASGDGIYFMGIDLSGGLL